MLDSSFFSSNLSSYSFWGFAWWVWLIGYALPGLIYVADSLLNEYRDRPSQFARDLLAAIGRKRTLRNVLEDVLIYTVASVSILVAWPAFAVWAFFEKRKDAALEIENNKPDFQCTLKYLISRVDPRDAEVVSYVIDPLGHVPSLPFGHLNKAWGLFLAEMMDPTDEMWSFYIPKGSKCGRHDFPASSDIRGFAHVRFGEILGEFITESD
jgi:hypothetical protein